MSVALPAPKYQYSKASEPPSASASQRRHEVAAQQSRVPPYLHRQNFIPHNPEDFGDGGAFPEIHIVQYPLNMGKPGTRSTAVVAVDVDESGQVRYDAIVKQGSNRTKSVQSTLEDLKEKEGEEDKIALPQESEEEATTNKTRLALEALLDGKIRQSKPSSVVALRDVPEPTYIRYTPNPSAPGAMGGGQSRVIRMVEAQVDPMEPAKHMLKKVPRGPPSPPVPVLHSPPRKITVADQQAWKVPPCISNWKNARGYTIPLDKRLAADGRGLQETTINNKFASLTEALYVAERKASEDLRIRDQVRKKMSVLEKEQKERELRELAARARQERAGVLGGGYDDNQERVHVEVEQLDSPPYPDDRSDDGRNYGDDRRGGYEPPRDAKDYYRPTKSSPVHNARGRSGSYSGSEDEDGGDRRGENEAERVARLQREKLRVERRKERERELRLENMKGAMRKNKVDRDMNRDVSEKIALNMHKGSGKLTGEAMYDSRLFNQSAGMDAGFGGDDEYNTYSKPLFDRGEASSVYRPKRDDSEVYGDADAQVLKHAHS